ncbi:MAG: HAD-IIIC family phosphatase [Actinobacteria bacterium]|nr:HAD-IIIC family phosphatase [Actinomycetota bacterium]
MSRAGRGGTALIKCVVWDLDHTLLSGVYLESPGSPPAADPALAAALAELAGRGILHAIASKNPPEAAAHAARATGRDFAAAECGWDRKSAAVARIAGDLGIGLDTIAFVDDDPYERAEVAHALPDVLVLSPEDAAEAAGWPQFQPPVVTAEARRRAQAYAERRRRAEAQRAFGGSQDDFLRQAGTEVTIGYAGPPDVPRLAELAARTLQFNSGALAGPVDEAWFRSLIGAAGQDVIVVRLRDCFGDDGLVGGCVVDHGQPACPAVPLLLMSCRAMGRGVIDALLAWLARDAARRGARRLDIPCVLTERNVPLRLALTAAGFRAAGEQAGGDRAGPPGPGQRDGGQPVVFSRPLDGPLPDLPDWVHAAGEPAARGAEAG